ncbi:cytochrome p450 monooxygenase [Stemphylium lycopersici]|uniref:Cytochrome p450 monooxygenase n=1 Tax=Stemphylium lycopersici TaxID=183478 RepID=A0A364MVV7_STELY|nr:cytochrome p450 monooxygenase [Stemphylium lycopersici]RAR05070.1 cytochrome p450 monooxygenase [Stemphylium lycopersici]
MSILGLSRILYTPSDLSLNALVLSFPVMMAMATSLGIVVVLSVAVMTGGKPKPPLANPPRWNQTTLSKRIEFLQNGRAILSEARNRYGKQPYRLIVDTGECLILPPEYALMIRNNMDLSFAKAIEKNFSGNVSGFEMYAVPLHEKRLVQSVVQDQLTKYLKWKETVIAESILQLTARLSTRVFLGDTMCRNTAWLEASKAYTVASFTMILKMTALPSSVKFLVPWFSSEAKEVSKLGSTCREILTPLLTQRRALRAEARTNGKPEPVFNDMIDWFEQKSGGKGYDPALFQIALSFVAIHTTTNEPQYVEALREEIVRVLTADGLTKAALANLTLMDSALKESQRYRPAAFLTMRRQAKRTVVLPNGLVINKGEQIAVDGFNMSDPNVYPDAHKYDIYRYQRMRADADRAVVSQSYLVSTGPNNLSFGHGAQGCPGRFFAANEMKIALCHMLLKYDWDLAEDTDLESRLLFGETEALNKGNKLRFRRRKEELDLEGPAPLRHATKKYYPPVVGMRQKKR